MVAKLRSEKGRWVDYVIEFARGIDNLVGYHEELSQRHRQPKTSRSKMLDFYFDVFLQTEKNVKINEYIKEIERYNQCIHENQELGEEAFFADVFKKYPEFDAIFKKSLNKTSDQKFDLIQHLLEHSEFLKKEDNRWMKPIIEVVRKTSLFFQPQIRTKIMNEGWASYWHERLFLQDDRIKGHEVDFARTHAGVTSMPRVGLNPYALGMRLFDYIEDLADKGKYSIEFRKLLDAKKRQDYDSDAKQGNNFIFKIRENLSDFIFINTFVDQDFINHYKLFVVGRRLNQAKGVLEYYVKSRKAEDYRRMLLDGLYHPPHMVIDPGKANNGSMYLVHHFEGKPLVKDYITNTMLGIEYLWGAPVQLETSEVVQVEASKPQLTIPGLTMPIQQERKEKEIKWQRVRYTMKNRRLSKEVLEKQN
jgi:stage V sporulation protein R